jgi:ATP-dependent Lhr-like helicase
MQPFQFHPIIASWFEETFGSPTEPQQRGWPAIQSGSHTLIAAPTGSGKTLAAFFASLDKLFREGLEAKLPDETRVLYVSPLKALSNDIHKNLEEPLKGIRQALLKSTGKDVDVRAELRTGDTPASKRQAIVRRPPHILVSTPESLYLLLTSESGRRLLRTVRTLIVDEIHAVVGNRRGSHLSISMERLAALTNGPLQRIGLSATQKPIEEVARFLVGNSNVHPKGSGLTSFAGPQGLSGNMGREGASSPLPSPPGEERENPGIDQSNLSEKLGAAEVEDLAEQLAPSAGAESPSLLPRGEGRGEGSLSSLKSRPEDKTPTAPSCAIIDSGYARKMDLAIEIPGSPLEAVMSNEVWAEVYTRLAELIEAHRTTLVFVNTRRLAERVTHHLCERLGADKVTSHHGSLSARLRLEAEHRLKKGELKALVATASLELGIDIGSVDLVCQLGPTRSIATLLQRVGRAEHRRGGLPKGRLFPLSRDELVECAATVRSVREGDLDQVEIPEKPLDVLAQQIVACAACEDWREEELFNLLRSAYPYRGLARQAFDEVVRMLAEGFSTKRGRRAALIHHDAVNGRLRGRRGARLLALTSGGAIPDNADYRVVLEPSETFIGTVNEDFAVESMAGDIFQLGNTSWRILGINSGAVRVEDAQGQPPGIPFWLGEAPGRTAEVSQAVSGFRVALESKIRESSDHNGAATHKLTDWLVSEYNLTAPAARQLAEYFLAAYVALGVIPSQQTLVLERFFDESGGMQLVIHSPFGIRVNRAWGLALRKRFCRSFNFELQAAATDDAIVLSLGTQHSFPLDEVFRYLSSKTVRDVLVQALLDAPMFPIRWRWNATRALALPRQRGGRKIPAPLQRMESENLLAAVFPDQLACIENIVGDREVPQHPLVQQTIEDCLVEAMDIDGLIEVLKKIEKGQVTCVARDLPEPSPLAHEILNAKPYAFLDNAPLEERRTQAVYTRRAGDSSQDSGIGVLDGAAIEKVCAEAWPRATNLDEVHEALLLAGMLTEEELERLGENTVDHAAVLATERRAGILLCNGRRKETVDNADCGVRNAESLRTPHSTLRTDKRLLTSTATMEWIAAERLPLFQTLYPGCQTEPRLEAPESARTQTWEPETALRELVRGRMEISGPVTNYQLANLFHISASQIDAALLALEAEGFVLRGKFHPGAKEQEWCDRRLLARIHRLTINRLRAEIQPVSLAEFQRFLLAWQRVDPEHRAEGPEGLGAVLELLDGYELPAAAWEPEVLSLRVKDYSPQWLDHLCFSGRIGWGRLSPPQNQNGKPFSPVRSSPVSVFSRSNLQHWLLLSSVPGTFELSPDTRRVLDLLVRGGALFFGELMKQRDLLPSRIEQALAELTGLGWVTADSFEGLRALLVPQEKRVSFADTERKRRHRAVTSLEFAGRWSLLRSWDEPKNPHHDPAAREEAVQSFARALLQRYGVVFRRLLDREAIKISWYELSRVYRRLEARGEVRGGYFVGGVSGEQFAMPEAIGLLRSLRKSPAQGSLITISGADPLNLTGTLTPGPRVAAITANRILLLDGVPVASLEAGKTIPLNAEAKHLDAASERVLRIGTLSPALRPYYAN